MFVNLIFLWKDIYLKEEYDFYFDLMCGKGLILVDKLKYVIVGIIIMLENFLFILEEFFFEVKYRLLCFVFVVVFLYSV